MDNRRKYKRKTTIPNIKVIDLSSNREIGHMGNFCLQGMMLVCNQALQVYDNFQFQLQLPKKVNQKDTVICDAECKWCIKKTDRNYNAGFYFTDISAEDAQLIDSRFHDKVNIDK